MVRRLLLGIDEAGRGPLVGPMIVAGVIVDEAGLERLREIGARDSKKLSPGERKRLYREIIRSARHVVIVRIPPAVIDSFNLNVLETDTFIHIARRAAERAEGAGERLAAVYADAVGPPEKLRRALAEALGSGIRVTVAPKADTRYRVVSAASIVAKVERDAEIELLRRIYGLRGSGYPTDPETLEWLREAYARSPDEPPPFLRRSWGTLRKIAPRWHVEKKAVGGTEAARQRSILDYLKGGR